SEDIPCATKLPVVNNFAAVDTERIVELHADTAIAIPAQRPLTAGLQHAGVRVVYLHDDSYADIFSVLRSLGALTGRERRAQRLIASLRARTAALQASVKGRHRPSVLFVEQSLPLWTIGPRSYIATLIGLAGGRIATQSLPLAYAQFSDEALLRADPDVIVATADAHIENVLQREPWRSLKAVRAHHVFVAPDTNALVRPGPEYVEGLQWLIARFSSL
ncbi:MAG: ABC transporter substrate-binding protein, partial [Candidatus Baltobacteraceae bacterium]